MILGFGRSEVVIVYPDRDMNKQIVVILTSSIINKHWDREEPFLLLAQPVGNSTRAWQHGLYHASRTHRISSTINHKVYIYMVVDQNSFIPERPFFANKHFTFAKLSRTPCLSFAGPMLANNTSYEDSFTTCQITPENHGSLLGSLLNMQLASRNPFSGQIFFAKFTGPPPSTCTSTFARSFA